MSGTYALGAPWLWFARRCAAGQAAEPSDWFAAMTGRRGQREGHQFGGWGMFAPQPPFGPPWGGGAGWRAPKARRGDVRAAILGVLAEHSMNGYQLIQEIAERSGGVWKPSPGSIYPTLQQLEDEGLVRARRTTAVGPSPLPTRVGPMLASTPMSLPPLGRRWGRPMTMVTAPNR